MKHMRSLLSTAQVLRQVFFPPQRLIRPQYLRPLPMGVRTMKWNRKDSQKTESKEARLIKDEAIISEWIQMVNENNTLDPPIRRSTVLNNIDRSKEFLIKVSDGADGAPPVCKVVNKMDLREAERARAKAAHVTKTSFKQVELNWAIDNHDLSHRLKKITEFITKGFKLEVVLMRKKGKRAPTAEEVKNLMDKVVDTIKEANGMQIKPMEGEPGRAVTITVRKKPDQ
ncbi:putative translation initiation factor IF3 [Aspergillus aculeatinus CBS 121060]|uniref:Translation initiation factor IF3 n=1 Tax=Aspergillus aculeatinus CBS 121060 TaxID=1448322 RepID=A0ACD1GWX9_9EURO|nr:putative translation initiation factor IF3 [Aspergillus aculeatinus CBS 121060]RAH65708.1 putative translation initiation factor IF3 [Aspergillus aculeatinus CBS 121060]